MDAKLRIASMDFYRKNRMGVDGREVANCQHGLSSKNRMGIDGREVANCQHGLLLEKSHGH